MSTNLHARIRVVTTNARESRRQPDRVGCGRSYAVAARLLVRTVALAELLMTVPWSVAAQLAPAVQWDLYLVQTEAYLKENNYAAAKEAMGKIITLSNERASRDGHGEHPGDVPLAPPCAGEGRRLDETRAHATVGGPTP